MKQKNRHAGFSLLSAILVSVVILGSSAAIAVIAKKRADLKKEALRISAIKADEAKPPEDSNSDKNDVPPPQGSVEAKKPDVAKTEFSGTVLSGKASKLLDFNKNDYDAALRTEKLIVIYFYADWCPVCQAELPNLYAAFNELEADNVVGFRVNFNDDQTDLDEKNLAREFSVSYQHAKIFISKGQRVLKATDPWQKDQYLEYINKFSQPK